MKTDMEIYKEQFVELFNKMVNDDFPDDLLEDVKHSYTYFVEKSIYYLKMRATTNKTSNTNENEEEINSNERSEEEELISASEEEDEELSASEEEEQPVISTSNNKYKIKPQSELQSNTIYKKVKKNNTSKGVDNIEQLPLDWFTKVRQTQKQHNIIPRKSDDKK
jgi:hypothetical protein